MVGLAATTLIATFVISYVDYQRADGFFGQIDEVSGGIYGEAHLPGDPLFSYQELLDVLPLYENPDEGMLATYGEAQLNETRLLVLSQIEFWEEMADKGFTPDYRRQLLRERQIAIWLGGGSLTALLFISGGLLLRRENGHILSHEEGEKVAVSEEVNSDFADSGDQRTEETFVPLPDQAVVSDSSNQKEGEQVENPLGADIDSRYHELISGNLQENEEVLAAAAGGIKEIIPFNKEEKWTDGVILVTNKRAVRLYKSWYREGVRAIPLEKVTSVSTSKGMLGIVTVAIASANDDFWIKLSGDNAAKITDFLEKARKSFEAGQADSIDQSTADPISSLEKLAELFDRGLINEDEFTQAKQKIIDQM